MPDEGDIKGQIKERKWFYDSFYPQGKAGEESPPGTGCPSTAYLAVLAGYENGGEQEEV